MDGSFNGYQPYGQQQPPSHGPAQPSPSSHGSHTPHHQQSHTQHPALHPYGGLTGHPSANDSSAHPTLPPLQAQNGYSPYSSMSYGHPGSQSHTPPGSHTPVTASMGGGPGGFAYQHPSMLPPSSFNSPYAMSQSMMYPSSTATAAMSQGSANSGLPNIRPMPPGGVSASMNGLPSLTTSGHMGQQSPFMKGEEAPTHVVGSQGRRGILPSAPGRPNAPSQGSGLNAKSMIPQKDADGKFPCPHCNKTYLHAKHLKRHLLRHTGDRPYMCHLCKDTFSRSDILKRHFQKCSIRRGNPTGANHLAHQRRPTNSSNRLSVGQQDGSIGLAGMSDVSGSPYQPVNVVLNSPSVNSELSARSSRANSLAGGGNLGHRNGVTGLGIIGSGGPNGESMTSSAAYQPGMAAYAMSTPPNGHMASSYAFNTAQMNGSGYNTPTHPMSFLGQTSSRFNNHPSSSPRPSYGNGEDSGNQVNWSRMFSASGQDGFVGSHPANASSHTNDIKTDHAESKPALGTSALQSDLSNESFLGSLYAHPSAFGSAYSEYVYRLLGSDRNRTEGLKAKIESLRRFCSSSEDVTRRAQVGAELMRACLTVDNVKHLLEHYFFCQQQWPILHMPTFDLMRADDSLVLAMLCTGAVYSPKLHPTQVQHLIGFAKEIILARSSVYYRFMHQQLIGLGGQSHDIDELQALIIIQNLCTWNGDPPHREAARSDFPLLVRLVKAMGLLQSVTPDHYAYSILHASTHAQSSPPANGSTFNWHGWIEQEKRNRVLYSVFLTDAAIVLFFNATPQFNPLELRVSLPADDSAWDAQDSQTCADALGLNGALAQQLDLTGNLRPQQPGMYEALRALLDPATVMPNRSTNIYSKFILIHALIVRIIICQKALLLPEAAPPAFNASLVGSAPVTPMSQNDWSEQLSSGGSGPMTPTMTDASEVRAPMQMHQDKKRLGHALDKWKHAWDADVESQYRARGDVPRLGFCRDGLHFFYLGRSLLQAQHAFEWTAAADVRFQQVMTLLKQIREYFIGDSHLKLQEIGMMGNGDGFDGLDSLTLDMSLLFKPCRQTGFQSYR